MNRPFDRYTVLYFTTVITLLTIGVIGLFTGTPIGGVG